MNKVTIALILFTLSSPLLADNMQSFYAGASIGKSKTDAIDGFKKLPQSVVNDRDSSYKVFAGYHVNENLALEAHYADFGRFTADSQWANGVVSANSIGISGVAKLPVSQNLTLTGKLGAQSWDADFLNGTPFGTDVSNYKGIHPVYGIGVNYGIPEVNLDLRLEVERYHFDKTEMDSVTAGAAFRF